MSYRFGFFDVDCQELNESGDGLSLRPRAEPLAESLGQLWNCAEQHGLPVVFTTCCSGRMPKPTDLPEVLFVPLDPSCREWEDRVAEHRIFYLEKNAYGDPKINSQRRAYDVFGDNGNARRLVECLGVEEWVVFGNAFDFCVNCAARGLLAAGQQVRLLPDVGVLGARGYGASGTEENLRHVLTELSQLGAQIGSLDTFLPVCAL